MSARDDLYLFAMVGKVQEDGNRAMAQRKLDAYRDEVLSQQPEPLMVSRFDTAIEPAPEAASVLTVGAIAEDGRPVALLLDEETRRKVGGWLVPEADGQAYDGELAMFRGLIRTLRAVVRPDDADMNEVRRLLTEHAIDTAAARTAGEKSSCRADATPDKLAARERRLEQLLNAIRTHGGKWTTGTLQDLRRRTGGPTQRGTARRDLAELHRRGHLHQHGAGDGRYYTLRRQKGSS